MGITCSCTRSQKSSESPLPPVRVVCNIRRPGRAMSDPPSHIGFWSQPISIQWRKALVSLPRAVPLQALRYTSPEGPQPFIQSLPSRAKFLIPVYVFVPPNITQESADRGLPVVLDFHGGGFVLGSCLEQAPFCAQLARELGAVVLSVDYRMGPIDKFPAAIDDGEDILSAVLDPSAPGYNELRGAIAKRAHENQREALKKSGQYRSKHGKHKPNLITPKLDTTRIALSGFSSGGNLALNLALSIPVTPPYTTEPWPSRFPAAYQTEIPLLLYYPSLDCRKLPSERPCPPGLTQSSGFWSEANDLLMPTYLPRSQSAHPRASPGLAEIKQDGLHAQARIQLVLPELDSLSEQSETWVEKMTKNGRKDHLQVDRYKGMKHGWTQMPESWLGEKEKTARADAFAKTIEFTKAAWHIDDDLREDDLKRSGLSGTSSSSFEK